MIKRFGLAAAVAGAVAALAGCGPRADGAGDPYQGCHDALQAAYRASVADPDYQPSSERPAACASLSDAEYLALAAKVMQEG